MSNGINPQAAAAAALNPQAGLYGTMPRLPMLPTQANQLPVVTSANSLPGLCRSQSIPMLPPQLLAQLGQGLPRLPNGIPGLNLNQLTAQIAGSQAQIASVAAKLSVPNGSDHEDKSKIEEVMSNPSSPVNSESA